MRVQTVQEELNISPPTGKYKLRITFNSVVRQALQGMLRTKSLDENGKAIKMVSTHFEPDKAREAFPCFDEPELRVKYVTPSTHLTCTDPAGRAGRVEQGKYTVHCI